MEKYFCYGVWDLNKDKFNKNFIYDPMKRKINGGMWSCKYNELYYSDWVLVAMLFPFLYDGKKTAKGTLFTLKDKAQILKLSESNFMDYMEENNLDMNKLLRYDAILYTEELVTKVKYFESYYVESLQILNYDIIENIEYIGLNTDFVSVKETHKRLNELSKRIMDLVEKSDVFKSLKTLYKN